MKRNITILFAMMLSMIANVANAENPKRSELTIVDRVEVKLTATEARHENTSQQVTIDLTDALSKLSSEGLGMALHKFYIAQYDEDTEGKTDELTSEYNYRDGWWLTDVYDENTGSLTGECVADTIYAPLMYIHGLVLDNKQLTLTVGQVASALLPNNTYFALLYYINGDKAIEITVSITVTAATLPQLADLKKIGERNVDVSMYYNSSYKYRSVNLPTDSLYEAIFASQPQAGENGNEEWGEGKRLVLYGESAAEVITDNATAFYGGYWFNANGLVCDFGENAAFFCEPENWDMKVLHVGIYPNRALIDTTVKATLYIVGNDSYYQLNISVAVGPQPTIFDCELVETVDYAMEIVPVNTGTEGLIQAEYMKNAINLSDIIDKHFESGDLMFITLAYLPGQGYANMIAGSNIYNTPIIDEAENGYQMADLSYFAEQMGDESFLHVATPMSPNPPLTVAYGIGYRNKALSFWQKDGVRQVGDYYTAEYYLYSLDDNKKVKINLNVIYVDQQNPIEIVKTIDIILPSRNAESNDFAATPYDLSEVVDSLGCEDASQIIWMAYNQFYQLVAPADYDELTGFVLTTNGRLLGEGLTGGMFSVGYTDGEFHSLVMNPFDDAEYTTSIVATFNGKGYRFNIRITKEGDTAISALQSPFKAESQIFNLAGQRITTPQKGINIINGKKVLIR